MIWFKSEHYKGPFSNNDMNYSVHFYVKRNVIVESEQEYERAKIMFNTLGFRCSNCLTLYYNKHVCKM